jgi:hypothetical protein
MAPQPIEKAQSATGNGVAFLPSPAGVASIRLILGDQAKPAPHADFLSDFKVAFAAFGEAFELCPPLALISAA